MRCYEEHPRDKEAGERAQPVVRRAPQVGPANDRYEREADRIAADIDSLLGSGDQSLVQRTTRVQRGLGPPPAEVGREGGPVSADVDHQLRSSAGRGERLDSKIRPRMESAFGVGFSGVSVHRDSDLAPRLGARAFTMGSDIHFAPGEPHPTSAAGRSTLAHELTHVVQQGCADGTVHRQPAGKIRPAGGSLVQREDDEDGKAHWDRGQLKPGPAPPRDTKEASAQEETDAAAPPEAKKTLQSDKFAAENDGPTDLDNLSDGDVVMNHQIPALAKKLGKGAVTAQQISRNVPVHHWVYGKKGVEVIPELGIHLRPVILLMDVLADGKYVARNRVVYRADSRGPRKDYHRSSSNWDSKKDPGILERGFRGYQADVDMWLHNRGFNNSHVDFEERSSALISTTTERSVAAGKFAPPDGFVYTMVVPVGIDISKMAFMDYLDEFEIAVPYAIEPEHFLAVVDMKTGETIARLSNINTQATRAERLKKIESWREEKLKEKKTPEAIAKVEAKFARLKKAVDDKAVSDDDLQKMFDEATGGGGGGAKGVDWQLITKSRDFVMFADLYRDANVNNKVKALEKANLIDMLRKPMGTDNDAEVATKFEKGALPKLEAKFGDKEVLENGAPQKSWWTPIWEFIVGVSD